MDTKAKDNKSGLIIPRRVCFSKEFEEGLLLREFEGIDCDGSVLIEGFPSMTLTGVLTVGYLADKLKLPIIGVISSTKFPPKCIIESSQPFHPIRIRGNKNITVVHCEFKIPTNELTAGIANVILDFCQRHRCRMLFTVEGLPLTEKPATPEEAKPLRFLTTDVNFAHIAVNKFKCEAISDGILPGITGLLLAECVFRGPGATTPTPRAAAQAAVESAAIMAGSQLTTKLQVPLVHEHPVTAVLSPCRPDIPDCRSAVRVIEMLNEYLGLKIDLTELNEKADSMEKGVKKLHKEERELKQQQLSSMYT